MNAKVFNLMSRVYETRFLVQNNLCECKWGLNENACNLKQGITVNFGVSVRN